MNFQEDVARNLKQLSVKAAGEAAHALNELSKLLISLMIANLSKSKDKKAQKEGEIALKKMLEKVNKGETLNYIVIADEDIEKLKPLLKECGVLYAVADMKKDDAKTIVFLNSDSEKVQDALTLLKSDRGLINEIDANLFLKHTDGKSIGVVELDAVEVELFRHHAKASDLVFAVTKSDNKMNVMYDIEDKKKIEDILAKVAWDLTGERGPQVRQQVEYRIQGKREVNIAVEDAKREYFIVNATNPKNYIKLTNQDFTYYKNNKEVSSMNRMDPDFKDAVYTKIEGLVEPVVLSREEFNTTPNKLKENIEKKNAIYPVGYSAFEDIEKKFKETRAREIAGMKMSLDNGYQLENASDYSNPDVSFSEFLENEIVNDGRDKEHAEAALSYSKSFENKELGIVKNSKVLDEKIDKAANIRTQQEANKDDKGYNKDER